MNEEFGSGQGGAYRLMASSVALYKYGNFLAKQSDQALFGSSIARRAVKWLLFDAVSGIQVGDKAAPIEFLNQFCVNESFRFKIGDCGIPQFHQPLHIVQTFR